MDKGKLCVGMRVEVIDYCNEQFEGISGTIIEVKDVMGYNCLVEFDEYVDGHNGLGWGDVVGKEGYCFWFSAQSIEEIQETIAIPDACSITYDELFE